MKRIVALLLVIALVAVLFVGCSPVGTYHVKTIDGKKPLDYVKKEVEDELKEYDKTFEDYLKILDLEEKDLEDPITLELKKDGKYKLTTFMSDEAEKGTWKKDGNSIILKPEEGKKVELTVKGGKLILKDDFMGDDKVEIVFGR